MKHFNIRLLAAAFASVLFLQKTFAQEEVSLDLLAAPATPAATMLGFSPSEIDKPRDPLEFLASLSNSTGGFEALPTNYAVEIAPAWMFTGKNIGMKRFQSNQFKENFWQGMTVSAAVDRPKNLPDSLLGNTKVAFGFKTSFLRGEVSPATKQKLADTKTILDSLAGSYLDAIANDPKLEKAKTKADKDARKAEILAEIEKKKAAELEKLNKMMNSLRFDRVGWKLDFVAGMVLDFPKGSFDNSNLSKAGIWLTGGYEWEKGFSVLGIARWLQNPDALFSNSTGSIGFGDVQTLDLGGRLLFAPAQSRFTLSAEAIFRDVNTEPSVVFDPSWKFNLNAEYRFRKNKSLAFSYGRDFDGTVSRDGNVIALLSLFTGFGSDKKM